MPRGAGSRAAPWGHGCSEGWGLGPEESRSQLLQPRQPGVEVRALGSNDVQSDQCGHLGPDDRFCIVGKMGDDPLARGRLLSVVDQLGRRLTIGDRLKFRDLRLTVIVEASEPRGVGEEVRLVLVQLEIGDEARVADVLREGSFEELNPLSRDMP